MTRRFECILDPCERYFIWDNERDLPVLFDGSMLTHPNKQDAERIARLLDACDRAGRELHTLLSSDSARHGCAATLDARLRADGQTGGRGEASGR